MFFLVTFACGIRAPKTRIRKPGEIIGAASGRCEYGFFLGQRIALLRRGGLREVRGAVLLGNALLLRGVLLPGNVFIPSRACCPQPPIPFVRRLEK